MVVAIRVPMIEPCEGRLYEEGDGRVRRPFQERSIGQPGLDQPPGGFQGQ